MLELHQVIRVSDLATCATVFMFHEQGWQGRVLKG